MKLSSSEDRERKQCQDTIADCLCTEFKGEEFRVEVNWSCIDKRIYGVRLHLGDGSEDVKVSEEPVDFWESSKTGSLPEQVRPAAVALLRRRRT